MNEKELQDKIKGKVKDLGGFTYIPHDNTRAGVPDLFCSKDGVGYWFELKYVDEQFESDVTLQHKLGARQSNFLRQADIPGGVLIGFQDGVSVVPTKQLTPGPERKFDGLTLISFDDLEVIFDAN